MKIIIDPSLFVKDENKTQWITKFMDHFYKIPNTEIGEASYFITKVKNNENLFTVISEGIGYGDQMGYINSKLV